jgi:hypothetical protein
VVRIRESRPICRLSSPRGSPLVINRKIAEALGVTIPGTHELIR